MKPRRVKKLDPAEPLAENAARIVRVRVAELRSFAPKALALKGTRAQHDMRIAAKRLRYVLEATGFCLGDPADLARRSARELQGLLGEIHDCDVMLPRVRDHAAELRSEDAAAVRRLAGDSEDLDPRLAVRAPHRTAYRGLDMLEIYLESRRRLLFDRFRELWELQERERTWEDLDRAAAATIGHPQSASEAERRASRSLPAFPAPADRPALPAAPTASAPGTKPPAQG